MFTRPMMKSGEQHLEGGEIDPKAVSELLPQVYEELRRLARRYMRREKPGQSIQATVLVHEVYLRLLRDKRQPWQNRTHFFAIAANSMRQILVERARAHSATKRGGSRVRVTIGEAVAAGKDPSLDLIELNEALDKLATFDPRLSRIVELRFFSGLTNEEVAEATGVSPATVKRNWSIAKAWLKRELSEGSLREP